MTPRCASPRAFVSILSALSAPTALGTRPAVWDFAAQAADSCPNLHAWAQRSVAEQLAPWSEKGYTMKMVDAAVHQEPIFRPRTTIAVEKGNVIADNQPWARYMKRAVENWPFA